MCVSNMTECITVNNAKTFLNTVAYTKAQFPIWAFFMGKQILTSIELYDRI